MIILGQGEERTNSGNLKKNTTQTKDERKKKQANKSRAEELLKRFDLGGKERDVVGNKKMIKKVKEKSKLPKMTRYGKQNLAAGPGLHDAKNIILVEGRADVANLMKMGIDNTIALEGTNVPGSVIHLCKQREVTALLDGDRGGDAILKELLIKADIEYVARAPMGREIEHLNMVEVKQVIADQKPILLGEFVNEKMSLVTFLKKNHRLKYYEHKRKKS
jgi:DNA primase